MPPGIDHAQEAIRCEQFATRLQVSGNPFTEWEAVALFYSAMHWLDQYLAAQPNPPRSHRGRMLRAAAISDDLYNPYRLLEDASIDGRYGASRFDQTQLKECWDALA